MKKRPVRDYISAYLEYTKNTEPAISYHIWSSIATISGALERKCFFRWGHNVIYPNQYIILVGPSGMSRKSDALGVARSIMSEIGLTMAAQSTTRESLIQQLANSMQTFTAADGTIDTQSALTIVASELSVFLGQQEIKLLADLTDWYDSAARWTYQTKTSGTDFVTGVCVNMLGATAPDWLPSILPQEAVGGGWTSRTIFVVEEDKGQVIANPNDFPVDKDLWKRLLETLEEIKIMTGEFTFDNEAMEDYTEWYLRQEGNIKAGKWPIPDPKFGGYLARRATHIKKLCMCISASRGGDLIVTREDFRRARLLLETTEKKMPRAFRGLGRARFAEMTDIVLGFIMKRKRTTRSALLQTLHRDVDSWTLENIERILEQMKLIKRIIQPQDDEVIYEYIGEDVSTEFEVPDVSWLTRGV